MNLRTVIGVAELNALIGQDDVLIVDCRFDINHAWRGRQDYEEGHIPGALYADLDRDLSDLAKMGLGRHPLPDASTFAKALGRWGWTPQKRVIAYDNANGALAATRLWWMLRLIGHRDAAVLDGGFAAWKTAGLKLEAVSAAPTPTAVNANFDSRQIVSTDELRQRSQSIFLLDARAAPRFRGEVEPIDPVAGHVPGARNRPFSENLTGDGRFKDPATLRSEFSALLGAVPPNQVVHMCGSGVTACHNLLAMEHAGLTDSRIYAPSWSGWIDDRSRPVATGID